VVHDIDVFDRGHSVDSESLQSQAPRASPVDPSPARTVPAGEVNTAVSGIPFSVRQQFRQQEIERERISEQFRQEGQQKATDEEFLVQQAREWQGRCWICAQEGRDSEHELYYCPAESSQQARTWMIQVRRQVRYAAFSSCYRCGMPQTLCLGWQTETGGPCMHRGLLYPMVGMMLFGGPEQARIEGLWQQRLAAVGIDAQDERQVVEFFGRRSEGPQGYTGLVETFIWLRRLYSSIGR